MRQTSDVSAIISEYEVGDIMTFTIFRDGETLYVDVAVSYTHLKVNGVWGYIDTNGESAIDPAFEEAGSFTGNLAAVKRNGVWLSLIHIFGAPPRFFGQDQRNGVEHAAPT